MITHLLRRLFGAAGAADLHRTKVQGFAVRIEPLAPHLNTSALAARLDRVLALVDGALPGHLDAARPYVSALVVRRFPCRGAYFPGDGALLIELTFLADPARTDAEIGATLAHELEHARLRGGGLAATMSAADEERSCRHVEICFGERVPDGEVVLARAHAALHLDDQGVAPDVDWELAWQRTHTGKG